MLTLIACGAGPESAVPGAPDVAIHSGGGLVGTRTASAFVDVSTAFAIERTAPAAAPAADTLASTGTTPISPAIDLDVAIDAAIGSLEQAIRADQADLPQPSWWSGSCNANRSRGARPLGGSFRGVLACGPQPGKSDGRLVRFFPTAWGEYEWQCTELSYRFMYLAYGIVPYNGNGDQVVDNYRPQYGGSMVKVANGSGELPVAGDVLSFLSVHTAIVTGVHVDAEGNGSIDILEQNAPGDGTAKLAVNGFRIARVKNWLHHLVG
jgi:hypothetical protein